MQKLEDDRKVNIQIFCSYDEEDRRFLKELKKHMKPTRNMNFTIWDDNDVGAGEIREQEIKEHLDQADIILLLISPDALASENFKIEMNLASERNEAKVIPIILRPSNWEDHKFGNTTLGDLQTLPRNGEPITHAQNHEAWTVVVKEIGKVVKKLLESQPGGGENPPNQLPTTASLVQQTVGSTSSTSSHLP